MVCQCCLWENLSGLHSALTSTPLNIWLLGSMAHTFQMSRCFPSTTFAYDLQKYIKNKDSKIEGFYLSYTWFYTVYKLQWPGFHFTASCILCTVFVTNKILKS